MKNDFYTYREIRQQPKVWREAYSIIRARKQEILSFTDKYLNAGYQVILTGAGTSAYIGDALEPSLLDTRFKGARALATTDIITNPGLYLDKSSKILLVSFARSGNSPESVGAIKAVEATAGEVAHISSPATKTVNWPFARERTSFASCCLRPPTTFPWP